MFFNENDQEARICYTRMLYKCRDQSFPVRRHDLAKSRPFLGRLALRLILQDYSLSFKQAKTLESSFPSLGFRWKMASYWRSSRSMPTPRNTTKWSLTSLSSSARPPLKESKWDELLLNHWLRSDVFILFSSFKSLERIQNKMLYRQYIIHKQNMIDKNKQPNEMNLFHGTAASSIDKICKTGFNRSYCGINGVVYGHGVYFAAHSATSDHFSAKHPSPAGKKMLRAKVLVGESTQGNSTMKVPPVKSNGDHYDSTSDGTNAVFVCYHDSQCLPEYLITYA